MDAEAACTAQIVERLLREAEIEISSLVAEALYVGLVTDTGRFQYSNTTPEAFRLAARLVDAGAQPARVFAAIWETVPFAKQRLLGIALEHARLEVSGKLLVTWLTRDDYRSAGADEPFSEGVVDHLRAVEGVSVAALVREPRELDGPKHKVSLARARRGRGRLQDRTRARRRRARGRCGLHERRDHSRDRGVPARERDVSAGGALLVDKPAGPTSHDVVAVVRRALGRGSRVGHAGTLDPFATGLLVVLWGRSTRLAPYLTVSTSAIAWSRSSACAPTRATATACWRRCEGAACPTRDRGSPSSPPTFEGEIEQVPPTTSAIHIDGRRAHELHRAGEVVVMPSRTVQVYAFTLEDYDEARGRATLTVHCSKGTYVRALVRDLGELAGCGAYCEELRREASGPLEVAAGRLARRDREQPHRRSLGALARDRGDAPADARARRPTSRPPSATGARSRRTASSGRPVASPDGRLICIAEPVAGALAPKVVLEPNA